MSFEQSDIDSLEQEKKKKKEAEKQAEFFSEKQILRESNSLLQKLAGEIARDFWIDISKARELISESTWQSLEHFKNNLSEGSSIDVSKLEVAISQARDSIAQLSKESREDLKQSLNVTDFQPEKYKYNITTNIFSDSFILKAKNPSNLSEQFLWVWVWLIDSSEALILLTYGVGKWIVLSPFHFYLLLTWKASYDWFSKI